MKIKSNHDMAANILRMPKHIPLSTKRIRQLVIDKRKELRDISQYTFSNFSLSLSSSAKSKISHSPMTINSKLQRYNKDLKSIEDNAFITKECHRVTIGLLPQNNGQEENIFVFRRKL
ncbi:hypothetical protein NPIL_355351 [Nephila pilipes]|uniref:Uncharacterized protein n=1 Tax=Nephila pilipes TaxID=299642 RepID=A0A8X6QSL4_NEPPI|nr:hypothetical protein NPIL_355351 [Nephila pilipes]